MLKTKVRGWGVDTGAQEDGQTNLNSWEHPSVAIEKNIIG